jgi:glycosyltransferase involved in cell wall biosynthesis
MRCAIRSSQRILTVSNAAKQEIVEYIGADPDFIDIASEAPHPQFKRTDDEARKSAARQRANLPADVPVIIFVGGLAPHKNLHGFLDGFERAISKVHLESVHLALVGDFKGGGFFSNYDSLCDRVHANPELRNRVHFGGYVSDPDLVALYSGALAVAMPSFSEGFGLPAIEAMACAVPVLASDRGALPEVVGDAGLYFDPFDVESISTAIIEMVQNHGLRARLSANALARAGCFTWQRAAQLALMHLENMTLG